MAERHVMYLLLRADLLGNMRWPLGAVFTQIAHAATACIWAFRNDPEVVEYMADMDNMHKVTLKVPDEQSLLEHSKKLLDGGIAHRIWHEDGMAVCIAVKPMQKQRLKPLLGNLPLYK
uniref:peptidyl-tRNA hydrolase n=1 Tax=Globodera rostochiensis TaxID=31243 RepID=A0A914IFY8_GLORO